MSKMVPNIVRVSRDAVVASEPVIQFRRKWAMHFACHNWRETVGFEVAIQFRSVRVPGTQALSGNESAFTQE